MIYLIHKCTTSPLFQHPSCLESSPEGVLTEGVLTEVVLSEGVLTERVMTEL